MTQVWLRSNTAHWPWTFVPAAALGLLGTLLCGVGLARGGWPWLVAGGLACVLGAVNMAAVALVLLRPRIAYRDGRVLVYVRLGAPLEVPVEVVECCFLGKGAAAIAGAEQGGTLMANVVLRLAEAAGEWTRGRVDPRLGKWDDHYITVYGKWCEPLHLERVNRLNADLAAAREAVRASQQESGGKGVGEEVRT